MLPDRSTVRSPILLAAITLFLPTAALGGNVLMQIECGNPPRSQATEHEARIVNFQQGTVEVRGEIIVPIDGEVGELWIDGKRLTLKDRHVNRGHLETEELGGIFFYLSESPPGYFVVMLPEDIDVLDARRKNARSD